MATKITEECINCGACEPECPNTAIYSGGTQYELNGQKFDALSSDFYYIVPEKCTECVGHFDQEQCAAVCPVDCCVQIQNVLRQKNSYLIELRRFILKKLLRNLALQTRASASRSIGFNLRSVLPQRGTDFFVSDVIKRSSLKEHLR